MKKTLVFMMLIFSATIYAVDAPLPLRVNCMGDLYVDGSGFTWRQDQAYSGNSWGYTAATQYHNTNPIAGTTDDTLYQYLAYTVGTLQYNFNVPSGNYNFILKFAECCGAAPDYPRSASVTAEGIWIMNERYVSNFSTAQDYTFTGVSVTDGTLNIAITSSVGVPILNALYLEAAAMTASPTVTQTASQTVTPTITQTITQTATQTVTQTVTPYMTFEIVSPTLPARVNFGDSVFIQLIYTWIGNFGTALRHADVRPGPMDGYNAGTAFDFTPTPNVPPNYTLPDVEHTFSNNLNGSQSFTMAFSYQITSIPSSGQAKFQPFISGFNYALVQNFTFAVDINTPTITPTITQTATKTATMTITQTITQTVTPTFTPTPDCIYPEDRVQGATDIFYKYTTAIKRTFPWTRAPLISNTMKCLSVSIGSVTYYSTSCTAVSRVPLYYVPAFNYAAAQATAVGVRNVTVITPTPTQVH